MTVFGRHAKHDLQHQDVGKLGIPRASGARDRWFKSSRPDLNIKCPWPIGKGAGLPIRSGGFDSRRTLSPARSRDAGL